MRKLLVVVAVLTALAVGADRVAVAVAQGVLASQLGKVGDLRTDPSVTIAGFPFLTQAFDGHYERIEVRADDVARKGLRVSRLTVALEGVDLPLSKALKGSVGAVPVAGLSATALVSYADLAAASDLPDLTITRAGDGVRVAGTVTVGGRPVKASALSSVELSGTTLVVTTRSVEGALAPAVKAEVARALGIRAPVAALPFGLGLKDLQVTNDGALLTAASGPTTLRAP